MATSENQINITNGPGKWDLFVKGLVGGERLNFSFEFGKEMGSIWLEIISISAANRENQTWLIKCNLNPYLTRFGDLNARFTDLFRQSISHGKFDIVYKLSSPHGYISFE